MPAKKSNLSLEMKNRLRQAVLKEIEPAVSDKADQTIPKTTNLMKKTTAKSRSTAAESDVMEQSGGFKAGSLPKVAKKAKTASKKKAVAKKSAKKSSSKTAGGNLDWLDKEFGYVPAAASATKKAKKKISDTDAIETDGSPAKFGGFYKAGGRSSAYKPAWDKPRKEEESLDELFKKPVAAKPQKTGGWFAKKVAKPAIISSEASPLKAKKKTGWLGVLIRILAVALLLIVLLLAFDIFGLYRLGFKDDLSLRLAQILRLPAGQVDGQTIAMSDYLDDLKALAAPLSQKREGLIDYSSKTDVKDQVFYRLAANELVKEKLKDYNQSVTSDEVDAQIKLLVQQAGSDAQAETMIKSVYGLDLQQFKDKILEPMIVREKLQVAIMNDDSLPINAAAKKSAEDILKQALATTTDFAALAKKYTQDETGVNTGGELGWVTKGQLDPAWENLIFNASSSTVLPQIVKSRFGYHILKVDQRLTDSTTKQESVKLRHILIKVDIDQYIKSLLDAASLVKYAQ